MDLQTLQGQLKTAIQNHQIVVCKMRNDPQNSLLQKQLHDLQAEIRKLSDKQKQVVQQLRKELEKKQQQVVIVSSSGQVQTTVLSPVLQSTITQRANQSMTVHPVVSQSTPVQTQAVALTTKQMTIVQSGPQNIRHVVPSSLGNLVNASTNIAIKTPVATAVLLPHCTTATNALLTTRSGNNQRAQPVLVVPSPNRSSDSSHTGVMLNLAPPIRVPQYPPPGSRSVLTVPTACHSVTTTATISTTTTTTSSLPASHIAAQRASSTTHLIVKTVSPHNKIINKEKQIKSDFMLSLGLVTKEFLTELKSRKVERKRRTTANPQFSNAAIEEKRKNAAFLNAENMSGPPTKRPRGRPRLVPQAPNSRSESPENNTASTMTTTPIPLTVTNVSVITAVTATSTTITTTTTTSSSTPCNNGGNGVINGYHLPQQSLNQHLIKSSSPNQVCTVCKQKGDLLKCSACAGLYHCSCLKPPIKIAPSTPWTCIKCSQPETKPRVTTWPSPLTVVHSYIALKSAKEEEKRKLLKRSLELKSERTQLQDKKQQLNEVISDQAQRRTELQATHQIMQKSVERLQDFIMKIKQMS
ncbi:PHD finger protein 21A-like [Centruroides vittatus]|uniref:PHD finger protein 21A-like n=1 Tax=Centruroides vittatus TaxID=120091 RepID=UPI00350F50A7